MTETIPPPRPRATCTITVLLNRAVTAVDLENALVQLRRLEVPDRARLVLEPPDSIFRSAKLRATWSVDVVDDDE